MKTKKEIGCIIRITNEQAPIEETVKLSSGRGFAIRINRQGI